MSQINLCNFSFTRCWGGGSLHAAAVGETSRGSKAPESVVIVVLDTSVDIFLQQFTFTKIAKKNHRNISQKILLVKENILHISPCLDISAAILALGWILAVRSHLDIAICSHEGRVAPSYLVFGHIIARYLSFRK